MDSVDLDQRLHWSRRKIQAGRGGGRGGFSGLETQCRKPFSEPKAFQKPLRSHETWLKIAKNGEKWLTFLGSRAEVWVAVRVSRDVERDPESLWLLEPL